MPELPLHRAAVRRRAVVACCLRSARAWPCTSPADMDDVVVLVHPASPQRVALRAGQPRPADHLARLGGLLAAIPLVGGWGADPRRLDAAFALEPRSHAFVKRLFNGAMLASRRGSCRAAPMRSRWRRRASTPAASRACWCPSSPRTSSTAPSTARSSRSSSACTSGSRRVVVFQGTMARSVPAYLGYGLFGLLLAVLWAPTAPTSGRRPHSCCCCRCSSPAGPTRSTPRSSAPTTAPSAP